MRDYKDYKPRRRVSKRRAEKRLSPGLLKAGLVLVSILALAVAAKYSHKRLLESSYLGLKEIVVTGAKRVERNEIVALSGAKIGENVLAMNLREMAKRVETQPWVERATVRRILPKGLAIEVKEREPFAILKTGIPFYLDRSGNPFKEINDSDDTNYPVITGLYKDEIEADEAARDSLLKAMDFIENEMKEWPGDMAISEINVNKNEGMTVFANGIEVKVGFGEYKLKMGRLKKVFGDLRAKGRTAKYIDLTYTGQVVVR